MAHESFMLVSLLDRSIGELATVKPTVYKALSSYCGAILVERFFVCEDIFYRDSDDSF
jgi:hypothetical protein